MEQANLINWKIKMNMRNNLQFTDVLKPELILKGYPPLLLEQDDDEDIQDIVFLRFNDKEIPSGVYVLIQLELEESYTVALYERGHSGGDIIVSDEIVFSSKDLESKVSSVIELVSNNQYLNRS